jgi:hypothetical protein
MKCGSYALRALRELDHHFPYQPPNSPNDKCATAIARKHKNPLV